MNKKYCPKNDKCAESAVKYALTLPTLRESSQRHEKNGVPFYSLFSFPGCGVGFFHTARTINRHDETRLSIRARPRGAQTFVTRAFVKSCILIFQICPWKGEARQEMAQPTLRIDGATQATLDFTVLNWSGRVPRRGSDGSSCHPKRNLPVTLFWKKTVFKFAAFSYVFVVFW